MASTRYADLLREPAEQSLTQLTFSVTDDSPGFDPAHTVGTSGLQGMDDRLAVRGELRVRPAPGQGTTILGSLQSQPSAGRSSAVWGRSMEATA